MATSSKVKFNLETLKKKALESIDERIRLKEVEVESHGDDNALAEVRKTWRAEQERKISDLFRGLGEDGEVDDHTLSQFRIDPIPVIDDYERRRAQSDLQRLKGQRTKIVAKTDSLVPDEEGNLSLTKTQLTEFFGL